ncbi:AbrB/MazE/SpoVT family DNA-binding domain-containing protein [Candidatus Woesearchaeota archaeon]|nr:AbrB/MazE/SpoVT family DNA-binding domain-containing protein [Candidatus Woesearchaeota archaeon]
MVILKERMTIGPKGQVVIPITMRKRYDLSPGDDVIFEETPTGLLLEKPSVDIVQIAMAAAQRIHRKGSAVSTHHEQIRNRFKRVGIQ